MAALLEALQGWIGFYSGQPSSLLDSRTPWEHVESTAVPQLACPYPAGDTSIHNSPWLLLLPTSRCTPPFCVPVKDQVASCHQAVTDGKGGLRRMCTLKQHVGMLSAACVTVISVHGPHSCRMSTLLFNHSSAATARCAVCVVIYLPCSPSLDTAAGSQPTAERNCTCSGTFLLLCDCRRNQYHSRRARAHPSSRPCWSSAELCRW